MVKGLVMDCFLALECSMKEGSVALLEKGQKQLKTLAFSKWTHQPFKNSHSDKLPLEIDRILKKTGQSRFNLKFLAVGVGPGRWTGVRTGIGVIRSLAFALKVPVFPVSSLRICAEPFLSQGLPVYVAVNAFKNQVYFAKFNYPKDLGGAVSVLAFQDWRQKMESQLKILKKNKLVCLSDLEGFYPLPQNLKGGFIFKKLKPEALSLAQIVFKQKVTPIDWSKLKADYLRSPSVLKASGRSEVKKLTSGNFLNKFRYL